jgi:hypothetical protein
MYAEAVKVGVGPSKIGLTHDADSALNCEECDAHYHLYYDSDAEGSLTYWILLAEEIITARHPYHTDTVALDRVERF